MKFSRSLRCMMMLLAAGCFPVAGLAARPLAIGPNGVDAGDLTGDAANLQVESHSLWLGTHGVTVWMTSGSDGVTRIEGAKFEAGGEPAGAAVTLVEGVAGARSGKTIGISTTGSEILLVWQDYQRGVLARRMTTGLTWLDSEPAVLAPALMGGSYYAVTCTANAQRHAVLININAGPMPAATLLFARLGTSSLPITEIFTVETPGIYGIRSAAVAARANGFLLAWAAVDGKGDQVVQTRTTGMAGQAMGPLQSLMEPVNAKGDSGVISNLVSAGALGEGYAVAWTFAEYPDATGVVVYHRMWQKLDAQGLPLGSPQELFPVDPEPNSIYFRGPYPVILQPVNGGLLGISSRAVTGNAAPYRRVIHRLLPVSGDAGPVMSLNEVQAIKADDLAIFETGGVRMAVGGVRPYSIDSGFISIVSAPLTAAREWSQPSHLLTPGIPSQQACAVAGGGTEYLVVWQDRRDAHVLAAEIRGRFFTLDGTPAGASFRISNAPSEDISPTVAVSGGRYLVSWTVNRADNDNDNDDIKAAMVTVPGTVSTPFSLAAREDKQENGVSVAGGVNGGFFAAWRVSSARRGSHDDDIYGAWIDGSGTVSPANGFPVTASPGRERAVSVAGGAGTYGVVWRDASSIYGATVPGTVVATPVTPDRVSFPVANDGHAPEIAWNGSHYGVVWRDLAGASVILSATLSEGGSVGAAVEMGRGMSGATYQPFNEPAIVPWKGGWQAFWQEQVLRGTVADAYGRENRVAFARLDAAGQVTGRDVFAPRFIDRDTLAAASAPDGGILIVYPTAHMLGKELPRTGCLETVLLYPDRSAADPPVSFRTDGLLTELRWKFNPWFPPDAGACENDTDLQQWQAVPQFPSLLPVQVSGDEAIVQFPDFGGNRRYFRLNSFVPGSR